MPPKTVTGVSVPIAGVACNVVIPVIVGADVDALPAKSVTRFVT